MHICTEILKDLEELWDQKTSKDLAFHKEAAKSWIRSGEEDRAGPRDTSKCLNPLDTGVNNLVNIYTGIKVQNSNAYELFKLGEQQHQQFEASLFDRFYNVTKKDCMFLWCHVRVFE